LSENKRKGNTNLGDYWPGIQLYYLSVKYALSLGIYEDMKQAAASMVRHAYYTIGHTLILTWKMVVAKKKGMSFPTI
jgi:hypothetical protein